MIKAIGIGPKGNPTLFVGLSFGNLDKFRAGPLDSYILIDGNEVGLSHDVMVFSGKTEAEMAEMMSHGFGPETKITISKRSKN